MTDTAEPTRTLPGHYSKVWLAGQAEPIEVRVTNRERVLWDKTAPKHKWGKAEDVPFIAATFCAWAAAKRDGLTDLTHEQWQEVCEDIEGVDEDQEEEDAVRPTQKAPLPASS